MQFTVNINQAKANEWGLNASLSMLFAFVYEVPSWAKPVTTEQGVFFALSKQKIVDELPILTDKPDTAYRQLKMLQDKGVIELSSTASITLIRLTKKGQEWNKKLDGSEKYPKKPAEDRKIVRPTSEKSPSHIGKISEQGSEKSPTNHVTINHDTSNQEIHCAPEAAPDISAEVLDYLNAKAKRNFRNAPTNTKLILARANEGATLDDFKAVIDRKCKEWAHNPGMAQYLRPATLFNAEKFNQYIGQLGAPMPTSNLLDGTSRFSSRHTGFDNRDYSEGLIEGVSDDAANF